MAAASRWTQRRLPRPVRTAWAGSLASSGRRPDRVLAWARTATGFCVGSSAVLSVGTQPEWRHVGWHDIEHGGWDAATDRLRWTAYGDEQEEVELLDSGRLPELFWERVAASIAVEQYLPWRGSQGITVSGRRDLGDPGATIHWHTSLTAGLSERTPGVAEAIPIALARVREEYDIG